MKNDFDRKIYVIYRIALSTSYEAHLKDDIAAEDNNYYIVMLMHKRSNHTTQNSNSIDDEEEEEEEFKLIKNIHEASE